MAAAALADAAFLPAAREADLSEIRIEIATKGRRLFRFLDGGYRAQIALLRSYVRDKPPSDTNERIALIDTMIDAQDARAAFERSSQAASAYGSSWRGEASDWVSMAELADWRRGHPVRQAHELINVLTTGTIGGDVELKFWKGDAFTTDDLITYLGEDSIARKQLQAFVRYPIEIDLGGRRLVFESHLLDMQRQMDIMFESYGEGLEVPSVLRHPPFAA